MTLYDDIGRKAGEAVARGQDEYAREKLGMTNETAELQRAVAEKLGLLTTQRQVGETVELNVDFDGPDLTTWDGAYAVLMAMRDRGWTYRIYGHPVDGDESFSCEMWDGAEPRREGAADTLPLAVLKAAALALGVE